MKKALIITSIVVLVFLAGVLSVPYLIDANNYKGAIKDAIHKQTGRDLQINGKITLKAFPDISLNVKDVSLLSPIEGDDNLLNIEELILDVKITPLIKQKVDVSSFKLIRPVINLHILKDGKNNWTPKELPAEEESVEISHYHEPLEDAEHEIEEIEIPDQFDDSHDIENISHILKFDEMTVVDGKFTFNNEPGNQLINISDINLDTSFTPRDNPFLLSGKADIFEDKKKGKFSLNGMYYMKGSQYNFEDIALNFDSLSGSSDLIFDLHSYKPIFKLALYFGEINLNGYKLAIAPKTMQSGDQSNSSTKAAIPKNHDAKWSEEQIDFSALDKIDAHLSFKASRILYDYLNLGEVQINSYLRNNKLTTSLRNIELYGGNINGELVVDSSGGPVIIRKNITASDIDLSTIPYNDGFIKSLTGTINANIKTNSFGRSEKEFIDNMAGIASLKIGEGTVQGVDLFSMVNNITAAFNIGSVSNRTRFKEISADFKIGEGVAANDNFMLKSDILNFVGNGKIDLSDFTMDYRLVPKYSQDFDSEEKKGPAIPVLITGHVSQPIFRLEVKSIVEDLITNPKGPENLVKQLKRDFKDIKKNITNDLDGSAIKDLRDIFN